MVQQFFAVPQLHLRFIEVPMRVLVRSFVVVFLAIVGAVLLALTSTMTSIVSLAATQIFAMGGTGHPLSSPQDSITFVQQYLSEAATNYVSPASAATPSTGIPTGGPAGYTKIAIITPEQFRFDTGLTDLTFDQSVAEGQQSLDSCINGKSCNFNAPASDGAPSGASNTNPVVVFGYSQSATIATLEKADLAAAHAAGASSAPGPGALSFVLIGNPNRPNGGFLARGPQGVTIPIIGVTFSGPTPTDTPYSTVDIAQQYDGWADGPENPLDLLADANALAGIYYLHPNYGSVSLTQPGVVNQGTYGDTTYYLIPAQILPLLMPLEQLPVIGLPLADTLDPTLQVLVEAGYNRAISPGQPTPWNLLYFPNPISFGENLLVSIPTGLDNGIQDLFGVRPFGTQRPGPYGVGGPPVTYLTPPAGTTMPPPLLSSPAGLTALINPTTLLADLARFSQLTSALDGGTPLASPVGTATGLPAPTTAAAPTPSATTTTADTKSVQPTEPTNSDATIASPPASQPHDPGPQTDRATVDKHPVSDSPPRTGSSSSTASSALAVPVVTRPPQPLIRLPIGANQSGPKTTATTVPSLGDGPVSKVLGGLRGGLAPSTAGNANSKTPAGKAGKS